MPDQLVVFEDHNARIVKDPAEVKRLAGKPNTLINPQLPSGVPPHHWKLENGKIAVMNDAEKKARDEYHAMAKTAEVPRPVTTPTKPQPPTLKPSIQEPQVLELSANLTHHRAITAAISAAVSLGVSLLVALLTHHH